MCIKTVKTRQKRERLQGAPLWTPTKAWRTKMEVGENEEEEVMKD